MSVSGKIIFLLFTFHFSLLLLSSCSERIDIHTDDASECLVIYGYITTDTTQHSIRITRSAGYFSTARPAGISNAIVTVSTDDNTIAFAESKSEPGLYQTGASAFAVEGKTYTLNISLDFDNDGKPEQYQATSYLPFSTKVDSIGFQPSKAFDNLIEVLLYGETTREFDENYYSLHVYKNNIVINDSLVNYSVFNDQFVDKTYMNGIPCFYLDQDNEKEKIHKGDTITLRLDVLTKEYAIFLDDAQSEVRGSIPFFSGPPANVDTNIRKIDTSNKTPVVGFFSAFSGQKTSRIVE